MGFTLDDHSTETIDYSHVKRVAILGAGVAGLQTAAELKKVGITDITIFEKADDVGGVWRENYADFGLQVPRSLYEFPGFPWPADAELFPSETVVARFHYGGTFMPRSKEEVLKAPQSVFASPGRP